MVNQNLMLLLIYVTQLNEEILVRVITMGHDQNFLVHSLQNKIHNDVSKDLIRV